MIGMLRDKNHTAVFERLSEIADHWYVADLHAERAASLAELTGALVKYEDVGNIKQFQTIHAALADAEACACVGDRIIVTGSFISVGAAIDYLNNR